MPFYVSRPDAQWIFKPGNRLASPDPVVVFEAYESVESSDFLRIVNWQKYKPARPGVNKAWVVEVEGPARSISLEEWERLIK
jgi:hypothetical protein